MCSATCRAEAGLASAGLKVVEQAAATAVWAAVFADANDIGGRYPEDCAVAPVDDSPNPFADGVRSYALDAKRAGQPWARSEEWVDAAWRANPGDNACRKKSSKPPAQAGGHRRNDMQELIAQLTRLYAPPELATPEWLAQQLDGGPARALHLGENGAVRALVVPFAGPGAWERLCAVANALQSELALPAPAVSIDGATGFRLWLSFQPPMPATTARRFLELFCSVYCPEAKQCGTDPVALPPYRHATSGKWAAFIHPGMGASFADEPALDMPPPAAGQVTFLQGLDSIDAGQLRQALVVLERAAQAPARDSARDSVRESAPESAQAPLQSVPDGLLLKDATLDDIVRFLHARNIEPTFRHLLR